MPHDEEAAIIDESRQRLVRSLNERVRVPVILFDPTVPIVWQMKKPWERGPSPPPSTAHGAHPPTDSAPRR